MAIKFDKVGPFYLPPGFGAPRKLTTEESSVVLLIGLAFVIIQYDHGIYTMALPQIQADLNWSDESVGASVGLIRLGVIPSLVLAAMADRIGRRVLLMLTLFMTGIFTVATAFAPTPELFVTFQFLTKIFAYSEEALSIVVVAETVKADIRGWAIGALAAMGGLGNGLGALVYGFVDVLPFGWRALYIIGGIPIFAVVYMRRVLPETERFEERRRLRVPPASAIQSFFEPFKELMQQYPGRVAALAGAVVPFGIGVASAIIFMSKHMQDPVHGHGFSPGAVSTIYLAGGAFAVLGNLAAGRLSDAIGRKRALAILLISCMTAFYFLYGTQPGTIVVGAWIVAIFGFFAVEVIFNALGSELFPTDYRSTASSFRVICYTVAGSMALAMESVLYGQFGVHATGIMIMLAAIPISAVVVWFAIPETATRRLEDIAPDEPDPI